MNDRLLGLSSTASGRKLTLNCNERPERHGDAVWQRADEFQRAALDEKDRRNAVSAAKQTFVGRKHLGGRCQRSEPTPRVDRDHGTEALVIKRFLGASTRMDDGEPETQVVVDVISLWEHSGDRVSCCWVAAKDGPDE